MKKAVMLFIGAFVMCIVFFYIHLAVGASVLGPKREVSEACTSMTTGMRLSEIREITAQYEDMDIFTDAKKSLQVSKVSGGWICVCKAALQTDSAENVQVSVVDEVFCSD